MSPRSILILLPLFLFGLIASAQYTEKINTNRPGTSQGAFSVGNNVLQLEGGMGFGKEKHKILNTKTNVFNMDYAVRYGLLIEQLELRLRGRFRADGVTQTIGGNEEKIRRSNFEVNTLGAKYLIYDPFKRPKKDSINYEALKSWKEHHKFKWKTLIPAVSVYAGANFVASNNPFTFPEDPTFSPIFTVITQNNWTTSYGGDWGFVTNLIIDKITTDNPAIGWIFTATHTVNDTWAGFIELQGQKSDFYSDNILRMGGAYLFDQDLQFDANIAFNFKDTPSIFTFSFGASYRFDWHTKDEIIEKAGLEGGVKEEEEELDGEELDGEGIDGELDELEELENDSLKLRRKSPVINTFEDDSFRDEMERDLDERRTDERLERERIEQEKIDKKEGKKFKKEEARRLKREAKEAREAEKAAIKAEKEKQKMLQDIDAELDKMEKEQGVDGELDDLDKQLQELERMEQELNEEEKQEEKETKEQPKEEETDVDAEYEKYQQAQEKSKKEEEKRRKKEEKKRLKEERKRQKEAEKTKRNKERDPNIDKEIDKELEDF